MSEIFSSFKANIQHISDQQSFVSTVALYCKCLNVDPYNCVLVSQDGLVKSDMEKLTFYAVSAPEKLDRIGAYLAERLTRDVVRHRYGYEMRKNAHSAFHNKHLLDTL